MASAHTSFLPVENHCSLLNGQRSITSANDMEKRIERVNAAHGRSREAKTGSIAEISVWSCPDMRERSASSW